MTGAVLLYVVAALPEHTYGLQSQLRGLSGLRQQYQGENQRRDSGISSFAQSICDSRQAERGATFFSKPALTPDTLSIWRRCSSPYCKRDMQVPS
ncbi:uncharacterized protein IUM83_03014 [Phytophthora cinnamomi]|uniref:uncharacterized protein n=1 Tax=Phytophthora cinnamomi TaxID=4785 RepID=UPI00355A04EC|nr:hypothetical protein IUM83_03014 [Phytophthora cinnamomi]